MMCYYCTRIDHANLYDRFMESLDWVDRTYTTKHKSDDPTKLREMYYPNMVQYPNHGPAAQGKKKKKPMDAILAFLIRFGRRAGISLAVYLLSFLPYIGRFVLPAASFYTFKNAVGTQPAIVIFAAGVVVPKRFLVMFLQSYFSSRSLMRELVCLLPSSQQTDLTITQLDPYFSRIHYTAEQKRKWFKDREGVLFGFGVGFFVFLKIPLVGVLIYGIAEASTAYLITKITDPPPPVTQSEGFAETQVRWTNKHEFMSVPLALIDQVNTDAGEKNTGAKVSSNTSLPTKKYT